jgi:hypothetical protein
MIYFANKLKQEKTMPKSDSKTQDKVVKTATVFGITNVLLSPLYWVDKKIGLTASLAANGYLIYHLHELGKERRPGANAINSINNFFVPHINGESHDLENSLRNVINGAAAVHDEIGDAITSNKP